MELLNCQFGNMAVASTSLCLVMRIRPLLHLCMHVILFYSLLLVIVLSHHDVW